MVVDLPIAVSKKLLAADAIVKNLAVFCSSSNSEGN